MSNNGFILDVVCENTEESGALTNYIPEGNLEGIPLIKIMNVDQLDQQQDNQSDGVFDFIEGLTVKQLMEGLFFLFYNHLVNI